MNKTISSFLIIFSLFCTTTLFGFDISRISPDEMKLPLTEQVDNAPIELLTALDDYHNTREFTQTTQDFFSSPNLYMDTRTRALETLIEQIPNVDEWADLKKRAENKLAYLKAIPSMLNEHATRLELSDHPIATEGAYLNDSYWSEFYDPLHRIGPEVQVHIDKWMATEIPNYFIFLETVEYDPLLNQFAPFENQVIYYLTEEERSQHRLIFDEGQCYLNGKLFDTGESFSLHSDEPGFAIVTIGVDGEVYVNSHIKYKIHHSSEFAGGEVISAGELKADNGRIIEISNKSGHYSPKHHQVMLMLGVLQEKLGDMSGIHLVMFQYTKSGKKYHKQFATFDAQDYFDHNGNVPALSATGDWTPLHVAVWNDHIELAQDLINSEFLESQDFMGNTPLHLAVAQGHHEWAAKLMNAGANLTTQNYDGNTPLHLACRNGDEALANLLISKMIYIDLRNDKEQTPLHFAAQSGSWETYQLLVERGANPRAYDEDGNHILHFAVYKENAEFTKKLLKTDVVSQIFLPNRRKATVLHSAAAFGDRKTLELILDYDLDVTDKDYKGRTPLHFAAKFGNVETTSCLLQLNDNKLLKARTNRSLTAFHYAAQFLPLDSLKEFIEYGAKINTIDYKGRSALFYAIDGRCGTTYRNLMYLLCHGADTQIYNTKGQAPVHYAAFCGSTGALRRLLCSSNDFDLPDSQGRTPLDIAKMRQFPKMTKYLTDHADGSTFP